MKKENRQTERWNGKISEEFEVLVFDYKGEPTEVRFGNYKKYEVDGTLKEEHDYEVTTYKDKDGVEFYGQNKRTKRYFDGNGKLIETEIWIPAYPSPYNGPGSLHTFALEERIQH